MSNPDSTVIIEDNPLLRQREKSHFEKSSAFPEGMQNMDAMQKTACSRFLYNIITTGHAGDMHRPP